MKFLNSGTGKDDRGGDKGTGDGSGSGTGTGGGISN